MGIKDIFKAMGKSGADDVIKETTESAAKKEKGTFGKVKDKIFRDMTEEEIDGEFLYDKISHKRLKGPYALAAVAAVGGVSIAMGVDNAGARKNMGRLESQDGQLSNMVGGAISPRIKELQEGKYDPNAPQFNNFGRDGTEGDLVFALHNLRQ